MGKISCLWMFLLLTGVANAERSIYQTAIDDRPAEIVQYRRHWLVGSGIRYAVLDDQLRYHEIPDESEVLSVARTLAANQPVFRYRLDPNTRGLFLPIVVESLSYTMSDEGLVPRVHYRNSTNESNSISLHQAYDFSQAPFLPWQPRQNYIDALASPINFTTESWVSGRLPVVVVRGSPRPIVMPPEWNPDANSPELFFYFSDEPPGPHVPIFRASRGRGVGFFAWKQSDAFLFQRERGNSPLPPTEERGVTFVDYAQHVLRPFRPALQPCQIVVQLAGP